MTQSKLRMRQRQLLIHNRLWTHRDWLGTGLAMSPSQLRIRTHQGTPKHHKGGGLGGAIMSLLLQFLEPTMLYRLFDQLVIGKKIPPPVHFGPIGDR
jgi:hypothetical protein